jgi:hypothetical protein
MNKDKKYNFYYKNDTNANNTRSGKPYNTGCFNYIAVGSYAGQDRRKTATQQIHDGARQTRKMEKPTLAVVAGAPHGGIDRREPTGRRT